MLLLLLLLLSTAHIDCCIVTSLHDLLCFSQCRRDIGDAVISDVEPEFICDANITGADNIDDVELFLVEVEGCGWSRRCFLLYIFEFMWKVILYFWTWGLFR